MVGRGNDVNDLLPPYSSKTSRATAAGARSHCSPSGGPVWFKEVVAHWSVFGLVGLVRQCELMFGTPPKPRNFFGRNRIFAESRRSIFSRKRNWPKQFKLLYSAPKPKPNFGRSLITSHISFQGLSLLPCKYETAGPHRLTASRQLILQFIQFASQLWFYNINLSTDLGLF